MQKIKHELINPLPGKAPRYDNIVIMVGEDQQNMPIAGALMKAVNKFPGYEHVKVSLEATPRGTGMSFSKLRNILKDPNASEQQQFQLWSQAFDIKKLGADWIKHLMDITRQGMGIVKQQPVKNTQPQPAMGQQQPEAVPEACWKGYKQVGMKKKGKRTVPNCVPVSEDIEKIMAKAIAILERK
jgi:hypothetical protein